MTQLSIIIVNYNAKDFLIGCLMALVKNYRKALTTGQYEILISDNNSQDGSLDAIKKFEQKEKIKHFILLDNKENLGFAKGNNIALSKAQGTYILFLNPDTIVNEKTLPIMIAFMQEHHDAGAATCQVKLPNGNIDEGSHRGFPTPWNAFTHFSKLERIFPTSKLFSGYIQGWKDLTTVHKVDSIVGAFMLVRKSAGEKIGWWDEDYFFYGEDIDFCYRLGRAGFAIYYVPMVSILHYGGVSSGIRKHSQHLTTSDKKRKIIAQNARFDAMRIFYNKYYKKNYPKLITWIVHVGITVLHRRNIQKYADRH